MSALYLIEKSRTNSGVHLDIHDITSFAGYDPDRSLDRMRELFPYDISSRIKFDYRQFHSFCGHLEAKTQAQVRYIVLAGVLDARELAFGSAGSETAGDYYSVNVFQVLGNVVVGQVGGLYPLYVDITAEGYSGMFEGV